MRIRECEAHSHLLLLEGDLPKADSDESDDIDLDYRWRSVKTERCIFLAIPKRSEASTEEYPDRTISGGLSDFKFSRLTP